MIKLKLMFLVLLVTLSANSISALGSKDTLLVYFSNNEAVNRQYYEILKLKFPMMNILCIDGEDEFYQYIPESIYKTRTKEFGNRYMSNYSMSFDSFKRTYDKYRLNRYYFFDISSKTESSSYQISNPNGQLGTTTYTSEGLVHQLELVSFNGVSLSSEMSRPVTFKQGYYKRKVIPLSSMDSVSDWINPLYVSMYLAVSINPELLKKNRNELSPCDAGKNDTIYLSQILNRDNIVREVWMSPKEKKFKTHLRFFKHKHIKLRNYDFSARAINALSRGEHFYFYYFDPEIDHLMIMDALDFKILYYPKVWRSQTQLRRFVKRCSKFSRKCNK